MKIFNYALIVWFSWSLFQFILSTFWDLEVNELFKPLMEYRWIRIFCWIFENSGTTQPVLFYYIIVSIFAESLAVWCRTNKKWYWWIWVYYACAIILFVAFQVKNYLAYTNLDDGFGPDISAWFFESYSTGRKIIVTLALIDSIILSISLYYLRFKFSHRKDVIENAYLLRAFKTFLSALSLNISVWVLKLTFLRPYYYQTDFNDILNNENLVSPEWKDYYLSKGHEIMNWGLGELGDQSVPFVPWYSIYDFPDGWVNFLTGKRGDAGWGLLYADFPSGHMAATYSVFFAMVFFYDKNNHKKYTKRYIFMFSFWMFYLNLVFYTQLISKTHWLSDLEFTIIVGIFWPIFINRLINKIAFRTISKFNNKKNIENKAIAIINKNTYYFIFYHYNNRYIIKKSFYFKNNFNTKKLENFKKRYYIKKLEIIKTEKN
ncbi:phosphatase PAP2 family protein [Spiroplasma tabanidicola]|nr:phosphatase PAP2 family protein [Spiroplasma tabanidicola]